MCHRSVGLVQTAIEAAGIPTVSVTHLPRVTRRLAVPRAVEVPWPLGQAFGPSGEAVTHRAVVLQALALLHGATEPTLVPFSQRQSAAP